MSANAASTGTGDVVLVWFAAGDDQAGPELATRLVREVGGNAQVLRGSGAVAAGAGLPVPSDRQALAVQVAGRPSDTSVITIEKYDEIGLNKVLAQLQERGLVAAAPYSESEQNEVARRLEALGYIE